MLDSFYYCFVFFFFSSRRRHTRYWRDWSSDVCSSDLEPASLDSGARLCHRRVRRCKPPPPGGAIRLLRPEQIGRASCRERVEIRAGAGTLKKKRKRKREYSIRVNRSN